MSVGSADIAVIGCAVSGASAALASAQDAISVSIFEEHEKIGEPSHCSGHVGIQAFKRFAPQIPRRIIENEIRGAVFHSPSGRTLVLHRTQPVTWVLDRAQFDRHMASLATKRGATLYRNSRVESFKRSNEMLSLKIAGPRRRTFTSKVLIDASGCGGSISKYAGIAQPGRERLVNSAQCSIDDLTDVDEDFVEVYFGQSFAPGFFGWIIPRRDGSAKVGIAAGGRANVRECFERFTHKHPVVSAKLRHAKPLTAPMYHPIPVGGASSRSYTDGVLAVGDAASQVKPTTGGGIVFGLACGRLAGETAARAIREEDTSAGRLSEYEKSWRRLIGFDLAAMSWLRRLLYRLPDRQLDQIFSISNELNVNDVLNKSVDIDFQGRRLLSLARDPRLFITLISASVLSVPSLIVTGNPKGRMTA